jgi:hypothetical protein
MTHTIWTAYGTSNVTWGGQELWAFPFDHPPRGLGQGNGAAPAIWALVSTPVLNILREQGFGAAFRLAISGKEFHLVGYAFVDNSDIIQTAPIGETDIRPVFDRAQEGLNTFVGGMKATGAVKSVQTSAITTRLHSNGRTNSGNMSRNWQQTGNCTYRRHQPNEPTYANSTQLKRQKH